VLKKKLDTIKTAANNEVDILRGKKRALGLKLAQHGHLGHCIKK
jgi:hypothetical protein